MHPRLRFAALSLLLLSILPWTPSITAGFAAVPTSQQGQNPVISAIIGQVSRDEFLQVDKGLSGAVPVKIGGQDVTLATRYTPSQQGTQAEQYVYEYFQQLGLSTKYEPWAGTNTMCANIRGRNVVAEIPGSKEPSRIYIFSAHLDSTAPRTDSAPGADDNASGTSAVMLAADILRKYKFDYTVRLVAFTGEERGLCGSGRYVAEAHDRGDDIRGVINADMLAYDSNGVKDVEIHAGMRPDSQAIASTLVSSIQAYSLNLIPHVLTDKATDRSDHASFWSNNYPAVTAAEEFFTGDGNPYYHGILCCDTWDHLDTGMAADYTKAILASLASLAIVHDAPSAPTVQPTPVPALPIPGTVSRAFPETGKQVNGIFLDYWNANGGLAHLGLPISEVMGELSELDHNPYTVQYFERAVVEYHPENQPPYNVLLSQLGAYQYKQKYGTTGAPNQKADDSAGAILFSETGKHVGGKFLDYWKLHGGVARQGYPISEEFIEQSPIDGKRYTVQYFERAVMEYHPENQPPNDVLLSQLGTLQYKAKHEGR